MNPRQLQLGGYLYPLDEELLNAHKQQILCVRGNCDSEVDQMMLEFPIMAEYCIVSAGKRMIFATHGHVHHEANLPMLQPGDVLLHGHTHIPALEARDGYIYANPGSVTLPKGGSARSYLVLEDTMFTLKTLQGDVLAQLSL